MKKTIIAALTIFLTSCNTLEPQILCYIDLEKSFCRCRCWASETLSDTDKRACYKDWRLYQSESPEKFEIYDEDYFLPVEHPVNLNVMSCNYSVSIKDGPWSTKVVPWARKNLRRSKL